MTTNECYENLRKYCMYPENKIKFLKSKCENNEKAIYSYVAVFQKFGVHEKLYKKDILSFTKHQLIGTFENFGVSCAVFEDQYRILKNYFSFWEKEIPNISFNELNVLSEIEEKYVKDFNEFDSLLNEAFGNDFDDSINSMRRACLYLIFLGVKRSVVLALLKEDISDTHKSVYISPEDRYLESFTDIPDRCMELFRKCKNMTEYISLNQSYKNESKIRKLKETKYLIRGDEKTYVSDICPRHFIEKIFQMKEFKELRIKINTITIYNSGLFSWLYKQEKLGRFDNMTTPKKFRSILAEYIGNEKKNSESLRHDYVNWKKAFNL